MADPKTSELPEAPVITDPTEANNETVCTRSCCYQIKQKYEEVLLELSSAKEIIRILQEERNYNANTVVSNINQGLEYDQLNIKFDNWAKYLTAEVTEAEIHINNTLSQYQRL
jgi:hypothetical protein